MSKSSVIGRHLGVLVVRLSLEAVGTSVPHDLSGTAAELSLTTSIASVHPYQAFEPYIWPVFCTKPSPARSLYIRIGYMHDCRPQFPKFPSSGSGSKQLYKKADEDELSQSTPSFSRELKPVCKGPQGKCPHPQTGVLLLTTEHALVVLPHSLPSPCPPTGCPRSPVSERKLKGH